MQPTCINESIQRNTSSMVAVTAATSDHLAIKKRKKVQSKASKLILAKSVNKKQEQQKPNQQQFIPLTRVLQLKNSSNGDACLKQIGKIKQMSKALQAVQTRQHWGSTNSLQPGSLQVGYHKKPQAPLSSVDFSIAANCNQGTN